MFSSILAVGMFAASTVAQADEARVGRLAHCRGKVLSSNVYTELLLTRNEMGKYFLEVRIQGEDVIEIEFTDSNVTKSRTPTADIMRASGSRKTSPAYDFELTIREDYFDHRSNAKIELTYGKHIEGIVAQMNCVE